MLKLCRSDDDPQAVYLWLGRDSVAIFGTADYAPDNH
jgi:hypothetical protein